MTRLSLSPIFSEANKSASPFYIYLIVYMPPLFVSRLYTNLPSSAIICRYFRREDTDKVCQWFIFDIPRRVRLHLLLFFFFFRHSVLGYSPLLSPARHDAQQLRARSPSIYAEVITYAPFHHGRPPTHWYYILLEGLLKKSTPILGFGSLQPLIDIYA